MKCDFAIAICVLFTLKVILPLAYTVQLIKVELAKNLKFGHRGAITNESREHVYNIVKLVSNSPLVCDVAK